MPPNIELTEDEPFDLTFPNGQIVKIHPDGRITGSPSQASVPSTGAGGREVGGTAANHDSPPRPSSEFAEIDWTEHHNSPLLTTGGTGSWKESKADTGDSLVFFDGRIWCYHAGQDANGNTSIGVAMADGLGLGGGLTEYSGNPILSGVGVPSVIPVDGELWMFCEDSGSGISLYTSSDGVNFSEHADSPVYSPSASWESGGAQQPGITHDGDKFILAFSGYASGDKNTQGQIGVATSTSGTSFTKVSSSPVLEYGPSGSWDEFGLLSPRPWVEDGAYYMNYAGKEVSDEYSSVGHASASSLDTWSKASQNPILDDANVPYTEVEWGTTIQVGDSWMMLCPAWFDSGQTTFWIGR